ncbi:MULTISPECIES: hypothetical protein [Lactococcus]|uniref:Uncharacterized protein n=2 Tax=Lactococcus TaxID=1357 RepID=A0A252CA84_9LACT|nr:MULTISPECIES: hypothetical protein [Lactococcus]OUK02213.1 hypothetical protein BZZ03_11390 [Lactococcus petauri]USI65605.1 hypothetical protein LMK05_12460 [Lactococcus petauri]USI68067.1 hypothetical protein LMK04_11515 [Lactococcus petauri]USJ20327.1 hypothetical protein LMK00_11100 [Lactococcus formosensis]WJE12727.1 hypothetical protein QR692_11395 [Lactococcus petauri]
MKSKKWYIIGLVSLGVILFGIILVIRQMNLSNMDGKYHYYYNDSQTYSDEVSLIIHGNDVSIINDDEKTSVKLDKKNKIISGWINAPYTYQDGVLNFGDEQYAEENSKAYKNSK